QECLNQQQPVTREVENLIVPGVYQVAAYPLFEANGEWNGVVEYIKDITTQQQMQARLYHSARLAGVGDLAAGVVHNFKNVLMGVSGTLDIATMLLARDGCNPEVSHRLQDAQDHVYRGNQVLERLLSFARGVPHKVSDVPLSPLLSDLVALCKAHPASRGLRINAEMPKDLLSVRADASQLHEVLMNLVLNAMQAMQDRGTVTIRVAAKDSQVRISVADTGCGITPHDLEHIFEPFYSRRASGPPGTGIGLSASLRMVRALDGDILVESTVGQGSTFTVVLPAAQA
ncbi:MAG TPA: ATP-binding protein, partial [Armatimonadota bacterium]|nr:ATP-binding protein [Armatimonadota bacterium]